MHADTPDEAAAHATTVTQLTVASAWTTPWQSLVSSLPALESLHLQRGCDLDPRAAAGWPAGLRELHLHLPEAGSAQLLRAWNDALPGLEHLVLHLGGDQAREVPDVVAGFERLHTLAVHATCFVELPRALAASALTALELHLPAGELPVGVCALTGLRRLDVNQPLRTLPDALADLVNLEVLDLKKCLNDATMDADEYPASRFRPMPAVVAALPALRDLNVDRCAIFERDIETLAGHRRLERLSLAFGGIADLTPLRDLPALRHLDLDTCLRVRDLSPLAGLPLRSLGLHSCRSLKDVRPLLELSELRTLDLGWLDDLPLGPVLRHPTLESIEGEPEILEKWARRGELAAHPPEAILAGLGSKDAATVAAALERFCSHVELTSSSGYNGLLDLFGLDPSTAEEGRLEVPGLSAALSLPELDPALAARVFAACFRNVSDSFVPALEAAAIVARRGSDADQRAVVDAVIHARRDYDHGHRAWDGNVHETLLDEGLPQLGAPALTHLLLRLSDSDIDADELEHLFPTAYAKADPATTEQLDARLRAYLQSFSRSAAGRSHAADLLQAIFDAQPAATERLADFVPAPIDDRWKARLLEAASLDEARDALRALVDAADSGDLSAEAVSDLEEPVRAAINKAGLVPVELGRRLLRLALAVGCDGWIDTPVLRPLAGDDPDWWSTLDEAERKALEHRLVGLQQHHRNWETARLAAVRSRLHGISEEEMRRRMVIEDLDRSLGRDAMEVLTALDRFAEAPFTLEMDSKRSRALAATLDNLRLQDQGEFIADVFEQLRAVREHLVWAPADLQYPLTYLLPVALEEGPEFFAEHVQPWIEGQAIADRRFAYNLACYLAREGDTASLCDAIRRAIELGTPKDRFLQDPDFAGRLHEPEVQSLLET